MGERRYEGARQGKGRNGEESRRVLKGVEGDAGCSLPDKSFSLSLASLSRVWFSFFLVPRWTTASIRPSLRWSAARVPRNWSSRHPFLSASSRTSWSSLFFLSFVLARAFLTRYLRKSLLFYYPRDSSNLRSELRLDPSIHSLFLLYPFFFSLVMLSAFQSVLFSHYELFIPLYDDRLRKYDSLLGFY